MSRTFIHLVGAQGVGKTTLVKDLGKTTLVKDLDKTTNIETITNVVRKLNKTNINKDGDGETQQLIFNEFYKLFNQVDKRKNWISDRGLIDVIAYTKYLSDNNKIEPSIYQEQMQLAKSWYKNNNVIICYIPIEFPAQEDGVRCVDDEYREIIDEYIKYTLDALCLDYYIIEGTVEERLELIKAIIEFNR